ncbi:MAG: MBL fold metallo-hydrolase [Candidatus Hodarchaeales archaeon]|jgi:ribonuclease BN (tRNA processing enzyme)
MRHKILYSYAGIATQILIQDSKFIIVLDVGDGIIRDLLEEGLSFPLSIPLHVFLSHGHYDHCGGLYSLLGFLRMVGQITPVRIYFPLGSSEIEGLLDIFTDLYSETIPFKLQTFGLQPEDKTYISEEIQVVAYKMRHMGATRLHGILSEVPALGFAIFKKNEKILAYTGDTGSNSHISDLLKDADHAYIEATNLNNHHSAYHLNREEAREYGKLSKNFTLIHTRK